MIDYHIAIRKYSIHFKTHLTYLENIAYNTGIIELLKYVGNSMRG